MSLSIDQASAVEKLSRLRAGALFMEMGTGKTRVAVELAASRQADFDILIWIAPASLIHEPSYRAEIAKWGGKLHRPVRFFSVEGISQSDRSYLELRALASSCRSFCVVDESLTIKNADAGRTKRLLEMWSLFTFRLILNGTPVSKGLIDLYAQINFIHPKILSMTEAQFANNFLQYMRDGYKPWKRWSRPENEDALIEILRPYIYDADLEIEPVINSETMRFRLSNEEAEDYHGVKKWFLHGRESVEFLAAAQKFQSFYALCAGKLLWVENRVKQILERGESVIVFVKFLKEIEALKDFFPALIYSGPRKDSLTGFGVEPGVIISTYGTGSRGLNLQAANNIIFSTQTFDWGHKTHGLKRAYRRGQTRNVNVVDCFVETGLEKIIEESQAKKTSLSKNIKRLISREKAMAL